MTMLNNRTLQHLAVWIGAIIVGLGAVGYAKLIGLAQSLYFKFYALDPYLVSALSPVFFVIAVFLVRRFGPHAKGSGIPQVLEAIDGSKNSSSMLETWRTPLLSVRTALIKVLSSTAGILGGASIGREGPTVQIAASTFAWVGRRLSRFVPQVDFQTYVIAGAAAGVAAAFNTPIAGITFAFEEITEGTFLPFRQTAMLAVIIAGITAQLFLGDYLFFGHPVFSESNLIVVPQALLLGVLGGLLGGLFSKILANPKIVMLPKHWVMRALICGILVSLLGLLTGSDTAGSGYEVTKRALESTSVDNVNLLFPLEKLCTTMLSYLSGMAGGIFSPTLSIGAGLGVTVAKVAAFPGFQACALIGMVAFFAGSIQAPLTAVVIVLEMTNEHFLILPFMIAAFLAQGIAKIIMPVPLYAALARQQENA